MDDKEYEKYVGHVVESLGISRNATIFRNKRYPGVRQPGSYEIDVACEIEFDGALFFLIIVECKNWKNPVDRPQIQKLIQTRDAINAHKAAFASPVGYTREAIEVAKAHGVALWVVAHGIFQVYAGGGTSALAVAWRAADKLKAYIYSEAEYTGNYFQHLANYHGGPHGVNLVPFTWIPEGIELSVESLPRYDASNTGASSKDPIMAELIYYIFRNMSAGVSITDRVTERVSHYRSIFIEAGMKSNMAQRFVEEIMNMVVGDYLWPFGSWEELEAFDRAIDHTSTLLLAPVEWIDRQGQWFFIYNSPDAGPDMHLRNNIIWANAAWLLEQHDLI